MSAHLRKKILLLAFSLCAIQDAVGQTVPLAPRTTFGELGILDMPSARMAADGELGLSASALSGTQRYTLIFQALPWLEGSFRYSRLSRFQSIAPFYDRSFGLRMRLLRESSYFPDVTLGFRDIVGTGVYGSEYLVASKRFGTFDVTAGLGWGRLGSTGTLRNPFGLLGSSFDERVDSQGTAGDVLFGQFFHGEDVGVFGGLAWQTPIDNLTVLVEYSSDRYLQETRDDVFQPRSQLNAGLSYRPADGVALSAGWLYGTTFGFGLTLTTDPTRTSFDRRLGRPPPPPSIRQPEQRRLASSSLVDLIVTGPRSGNASAPDFDARRSRPPPAPDPRPPEESASTYDTLGDEAGTVPRSDDIGAPDLAAQRRAPSPAMVPSWPEEPVPTSGALVDEAGDAPETVPLAGEAGVSDDATQTALGQILREAAADQSLGVEALRIGPHEIVVYFTNRRYQFETEALGRLSRVLMANAPPNVELFRLVSLQNGIPMQEVRFSRSSLERVLEFYGGAAEFGSTIDIRAPELDPPILGRDLGGTYPRFHWSLFPQFRQSLFDPNQPIQFQFLAALDGAVELAPGFELIAGLEANILDDYRFDRISDSVLPHVRSDAPLYNKNGVNGIARLSAVYRRKLAPEIFTETKIGYLEGMFAGAGTQVLWRPTGQRWAVGADLYQVWQRDFNRLFGVRDYNVLTGHVSVYYRSPWLGLNLNVHAGRYLAKDYGATFEVTRRFSTGVEIGAFATFTDVPFSTFGEGSFDKGIIIRIPLGWAVPIHTQSNMAIDLRPITRDGGQRLIGDNSLYEETQRTSYGEIMDHLDDLIRP